MDVLVYSSPVTNSSGGQRMYRELQVSYSSLAHLLLMGYRGDGKFTRLLL